MREVRFTSFLTDFAALPDQRLARRRQYPLLKILFLCVGASLSGHEEWDEVVNFGLAKSAWLRRYLPFAAGIPAHDKLSRVMSRLEPHGFETCLISWV